VNELSNEGPEDKKMVVMIFEQGRAFGNSWGVAVLENIILGA
jgi:hypothetical protein